MKKIEWLNGEGESVEIAGSDPYILTSIKGTGPADANIQTVTGYQLHGTKYKGSLLKARKITLLIEVNGDTEAEVEANVRRLMQLFNSQYGKGQLIYTNNIGSWKIYGAVYDGPEQVNKDKNPYYTYVTIGIYCDDPEWLDVESVQIKMEDYLGGLTYPKTYPIKYATRGDGGRFEYTGDNPTPVLLDFRVKEGGSTVVNPRIEKITKDGKDVEYIQLTKSIDPGQRILINTDKKNLFVTLINTDGSESKAWDSIKGRNHTYIHLHRGENIFKFKAESGNPELYLTYTRRYSGVPGD